MCRNLRHYLLYPSKYYYSLVDRINLYHYNCTTIDYLFKELGYNMLEKRHLRRRYNVYWVRVKVPDKVRHVIGKRELQKNLFTTSLIEANKRKHR